MSGVSSRARQDLLVALAVMLGACSAGTPPDPVARAADRQRISATIDSLGTDALEKGIVGLSIAVIRDGEEPIAGAWGNLDRDAAIPASTGTTFSFASATKPFTAIAMLALADAGRLSLDDRLVDHMPELALPAGAAAITIRHLLDHTSGLTDYVRADVERFETTGEPLEASFVTGWLRDRPLDFEPGLRWAYSNSAFYLAGMIIERVSGTTWADHVRIAVLEPLGLSSISPCEAQPVNPRSYGYEVRDDGQPVVSELFTEPGVMADGGLCGTALDLARMPHALHRTRLLSVDALESLLDPVTLTDGTRVAYGLGTRMGELEGLRVWGHTGGAGSWVAKLARYEDAGVTIAVLTNTMGAGTDPVTIETRLAEVVLGLAPGDTSDATITAEEAARYAGSYNTGRWTGELPRFRMFLEDDHLVRGIRIGGQERPMPLVPRGEHAFGAIHLPRDRWIFHVRDGRATSFSEFYNGMLSHWSWRVDD